VFTDKRRRQHVIPDLHPSSGGSICHGMPVRRTKTMPVRHARSETRGRPPFGRGRICKNGWTRSHNASGSSVAPIPRSRYLARRGSGFGGFVTRSYVDTSRSCEATSSDTRTSCSHATKRGSTVLGGASVRSSARDRTRSSTFSTLRNDLNFARSRSAARLETSSRFPTACAT
jgi:hypothetical protein